MAGKVRRICIVDNFVRGSIQVYIERERVTQPEEIYPDYFGKVVSVRDYNNISTYSAKRIHRLLAKVPHGN